MVMRDGLVDECKALIPGDRAHCDEEWKSEEICDFCLKQKHVQKYSHAVCVCRVCVWVSAPQWVHDDWIIRVKIMIDRWFMAFYCSEITLERADWLHNQCLIHQLFNHQLTNNQSYSCRWTSHTILIVTLLICLTTPAASGLFLSLNSRSCSGSFLTL